MKRINFELSDDLYYKAKKIAKQNSTNVSFVIREALTVFETKKSIQTKKNDPFFTLTEIISEGPEDLSLNHDKYIYDNKEFKN